VSAGQHEPSHTICPRPAAAPPSLDSAPHGYDRSNIVEYDIVEYDIVEDDIVQDQALVSTTSVGHGRSSVARNSASRGRLLGD